MATKPSVILLANQVVDVTTTEGLVAGKTYAVQNVGNGVVLYGEYAAASVPDPFDGHTLKSGRDFEHTVEAGENLYVQAPYGGKLVISGAD